MLAREPLSPQAEDGDEEVQRETAQDLQRRWRCPVAGYAPGPIDDDVSFDADGMLDLVVKVTGCARPTTCPRAALECSPPHVAEISMAAAVMDEWAGAVSFEGALGREPYQIDLAALRLITLGRRAARASDDKLREEERARNNSPKDPTP